jgi:hypothetical protein
VENHPSIRLAVQIVISLGLLGFGLFVISLGLLGFGLFVPITTDWKENPEFVAAATGWIGLIAGFWLR